MIDAGPGIPPHIALLLNEEFDLSDSRLVARKLKSMLRDLKNQAEPSSFQPLAAIGESSSEFRAVLSGGLDLFSDDGACQAFACRLSYAEQIARTISLMSDKVTVHDYFFERIHSLRSRPTNAELSRLVSDLSVLHKIRPLIEAGIIKFTSPFLPTCSGCIAQFEERVNRLVEQAISRHRDQLPIERSDGAGFIELSSLYEPPVFMHFSESFGSSMTDGEIRSYFVELAVRSAVWDARSAGWISGSLFSNSPAGISALLSADGQSLSPPEFRAFAAERTANLPWVAGLTIEQTLTLRDSANTALPRLREFMARRLSGLEAERTSPTWTDTIAELREQAQEVRSELERSASRSPSLRRNAAGILGLGVSAACLIADGPVAALGGLLGTLGLVHSMDNGSQHDAELRTRPGYVLVAAQDILRHARPS